MLPVSVKSILQRPEDEHSWANMEAMRKAICRFIQRETEVRLDSRDEIKHVAVAVEECESEEFGDEVGGG